MKQDVGILLVCMGNICRSPMAHAVMQQLVDDAGLHDIVRVDSAGTDAYHVGERPHRETLAELARRGVEPGDQHARVVTSADLDAFDHIAVMDRDNQRRLDELVLAHGGRDACRARVARLLKDADDDIRQSADGDVPDPYYEGGFDHVFDLVHAGCVGLLARVCEEQGLTALESTR